MGGMGGTQGKTPAEATGATETAEGAQAERLQRLPLDAFDAAALVREAGAEASGPGLGAESVALEAVRAPPGAELAERGQGRGPDRGLRGVLFDLDNTLVDLLRMKRTASDAAARAMVASGADFPFGADEAGDILFGEYMEDIEGDRVFERFLARHHQQRIGLSAHNVDRITAAAVNAYLRAKTLHTQPYPGVRRTLLALARRGVRMGVLTDAPRFKAYQRLDAAGLVDFFDFVVTVTDHGERKPHERPFRTALELFGLAPHQVLMVGDWPERDMAGAKAVGMRTAWARYGRPPGSQVPPEADVVLEKVEDLIRLPLLQEATRHGQG